LNPNIRFVHEDVNYDASDLTHTLFRIGGYDPNNFYDPRFLFNQGNFTQLSLAVTPDMLPGGTPGPDTNRQNVRLNHWLKQTVIFNQNITGSNGYILISGTPHNPDVVPGGEALTATVTNFPPNFNSEFGLKRDINGTLLGADSNALSMWNFPPYMNCAGGFLTDTLCVRPTTSTYHFRIIVMDSLPRFLNVDQRPCGANLTDSLRYTFDIQTDDESEDSVAASEMYLGHFKDVNNQDSLGLKHAWNFPYGKTNYKFAAQPIWMQYPIGNHIYRSTALDPGFLDRGIINVRVDSATAILLLTPIPQVNNNLNLDTIVSVLAHDGHTGQSIQKWPLPVNIAPAILTEALPNAKEGVDYSLNFQKPDSVNRISIFDPNAADFHTYQLVYDSMVVWRDQQYHVDSTMLHGTTPRWLHIDQYSGVLTGTPGLNDAPRMPGACNGPVNVTVVVTDQCQLQTWKTFQLQVDSTQHTPAFVRGPRQICITNKTDTCIDVSLHDLDLLRDPCAKETVTITDSIGSAGHITITPNTVDGQLTLTDTTTVRVCFGFNEDENYFATNPPPAEYITLHVTDANGHVDNIQYAVNIGDVPTFECVVCIRNAVTPNHPLQDMEKLTFGAGRFGTEDLDARYCEFEIPPAPHQAAFDTRWQLPILGKITGTYVDVRRDTNQFANIVWQLGFQAGNDNVGGQGGGLFPIEICWSRSCLDTAHLSGTFRGGHFYLRNPQNSASYSIDMFTGLGPIDNSNYTLLQNGSDTLCLQIRDIKQGNALIVFQPALSGVEDNNATPKYALEQNYPNPFSNTTTVNFSVAERANVRIDIYDLKGTLVKSLVNEQLDPGSYPITWDGTDMSGADMASGTYIAKMTAGTFSSTVKMTLEKAGK